MNTFTVPLLLKKSLTENFIFYAVRVERLVRTDCKTFSKKRYIFLANFAQGLISPMSDLVRHKFSLTDGGPYDKETSSLDWFLYDMDIRHKRVNWVKPLTAEGGWRTNDDEV